MDQEVKVAGNRCHQCGQANPPGVAFCGQCGGPLLARAPTRICRHCHYPGNPATAAFCVHCGRPLGPSRSPIGWVLVGVVIIVVALAGMAVVLWQAGLLQEWLPDPLAEVAAQAGLLPSPTSEPSSTPQPPDTPTPLATPAVQLLKTATDAPTMTPTPAPVATSISTPTFAPTTLDSPTATPLPSPTDTPTNTPRPVPDRVLIPAGEFSMGITADQIETLLAICRSESTDCPRSMFDDEQPTHVVSLDAFYMDRYEVTNARFDEFVTTTGYRTDAEKTGRAQADVRGKWQSVDGANWRHPEGPTSDLTGRMDHPVVQVSWNDAAAYCEWAGGRLPTGAEWERAARGTDGRIYPWGRSFRCDGANLDDETAVDAFSTGCRDGWSRTAPIGQYPGGVSPDGLYDMAGNVREWVSDWYQDDYYEVSPRTNPAGPAGGNDKVTRGSSWYTDRTWSRVTEQRPFKPDYRSNFIGFRCVWDYVR